MASLERLLAANAAERLADHDVTLWAGDGPVPDEMADRLGWSDLASCSLPAEGLVRGLARELTNDGITDVVLLGMGGSSLAALTMATVFGPETAGMTLHVVDTTSPTTVTRLTAELDPSTTAFFVSSKSGGTIEPNTLYAIFRAWAEPALGADTGSHFIAVTDPGSSLESLAAAEGFRTTLIAPPDIGGRYSALTVFGLGPAACVGIDIDRLLGRGAEMQERCRTARSDNPAVQLAAFIGDGQAAGRDKLTIVTSPGLRSFGLWAEQLIAESTGKEGTGIVPVPELAEHAPAGYGDDRAVTVLRFAEDSELASWVLDQRNHLPVFEIVFEDRYDLAGEFVRWEYATALVGFLLGINPFDQPNVAEAKAATAEVLAGRDAAPEADLDLDGVHVRFGGGIETTGVKSLAGAAGSALAALSEGDYFAILGYLPDDEDLLAPVKAAIPPAAAATGRAFMFELGPRYLHSTGQLHKGGPAEGVFLVVTAREEPDVAVPGQEWRLADLFRAQAVGDFLTLKRHGRPVVWLDLPSADRTWIASLGEALVEDALGV